MAHILRRSIGCIVLTLLIVSPWSPVVAKDDAAFTAKFNDPIKLGKSYGFSAKIDLNPPTEGYYGCRFSGSTQTVIMLAPNKPVALPNPEDSLPSGGYKGFDLFANGTVRLRKADGTFEKQLYQWRHSPVSGRIVFVDGPLAKYFQWPVHIQEWWLTHWISRLEVNPYLGANGKEGWVACANKDPLLSTR